MSGRAWLLPGVGWPAARVVARPIAAGRPALCSCTAGRLAASPWPKRVAPMGMPTGSEPIARRRTASRADEVNARKTTGPRQPTVADEAARTGTMSCGPSAREIGDAATGRPAAGESRARDRLTSRECGVAAATAGSPSPCSAGAAGCAEPGLAEPGLGVTALGVTALGVTALGVTALGVTEARAASVSVATGMLAAVHDEGRAGGSSIGGEPAIVSELAVVGRPAVLGETAGVTAAAAVTDAGVAVGVRAAAVTVGPGGEGDTAAVSCWWEPAARFRSMGGAGGVDAPAGTPAGDGAVGAGAATADGPVVAGGGNGAAVVASGGSGAPVVAGGGTVAPMVRADTW